LPEGHQPLLNTAYLRSVWAQDYETFKESPEAQALLTRLKNWAGKDWQKETASESAFIDVFFKQTWGHVVSGEADKKAGYTLQQQFPVKGAGQKGGTGGADIALGRFGCDNTDEIPQVLGEFKDDRSGLDKPQSSRPNDRSPVDQCLDYLREARTGLISPILPTWGLVTDMNEFRLYLYGNKAQYQRFIIKPAEGELIVSLLGDGDDAAFHRFLFYRTFHADWILTTGGKSKLERLLGGQITHEQALENQFYLEYHTFRKTVYQALRQHNPQYEQEGSLRRLVKFAQRILDRCLFILYCEDMGQELNFPPNILRDVLIDVANDQFYDPDGTNAWNRIQHLFVSMRDGTPFGPKRINKFNGGLFEEDLEMDALNIPNRVFCEKNQGQSVKRLLRFPKTLLHFSAKYNFGEADDSKERTLTLTAMGRIFEQSITDLEVMEAHAEGRESLTELTKRKRDGVYYTPEWVTYYIVENTVGARLAEIRKELDFDKFMDVTGELIEVHQRDHRKAKMVGEYKKALQQYRKQLDTLKVVDPACGSGAFLIQAFKYLYEQRKWIANELERVTRAKEIFDTHFAMCFVLSKNLYGVDINAESVEITRLALWLHTARPDRPLTALDQNIRCGNSLIGHDFYEQMSINRDLFGENERERVNTFDWEKTFPEVYQRENPGFDCVIGNPPYVKLQHFHKIQEDVARYLLEAKREGGRPLYESTQTGNFDMYLPFIERGVELLNQQGKMGFIAPNVWMVNEYGKGLRQKLRRTRRLDRWIDFKSFQVFDEAITYTALQFFAGFPQDRIRCVFAPGGKQDIASVDWREVKDAAFYQELPEEESWRLVPSKEKDLIASLTSNNQELGLIVGSISQGLISGAFWIFANERIGQERCFHTPKQQVRKSLPHEIEIEQEITLALATGDHIKRYQSVNTDLAIIFPYTKDGKAKLYEPSRMSNDFPKAWVFLKTYEAFLRQRDGAKLDDDQWYRYSRNQNLEKQSLPKLMIAGTAQSVLCAVDERGEIAANDKRVYSIFTSSVQDLWFLAGILNSPTVSFVFKRIARPKAGGFFDIETQFLAPLPIPHASDEEKVQVAERAKRLQELHTQRRDLLLAIDSRLASPQCEDDKRDESWLWADVKLLAAIKKHAPPELKGRELTAWAKFQRELKLTARLDAVKAMLRPGVQLSVANEYGELNISANGVSLIKGIYLHEDEAAFISAQWRQKARKTNVTEKFDAKRLMNLLLKLRKTDNDAIRKQVVKIDADIQTLDAEIEATESDMNQLTYRLYKLTEEDIQLVEGRDSV
jgi:hypothetical protein